MATTPYRRLQEENVSIKKRNKELEDISDSHKKLVGNLCSEIRTLEDKLADKDTVINLLKDRLQTSEEPLRLLCRILKITSFFDNARATQMKQARDIVDINYVP